MKTTRAANIECTAVMMAEAIQRGGLVHVSGSGHFAVRERSLVRP
jgi:uncharacterized phosphosugar-binding protein